jgi:hypothetical protein
MVSVPLYEIDRVRSFQTPPFDWNMLCQACESQYAPLDRLGVSVFRDGHYSKVVPFPSLKLYGLGNVDPTKLRQFLLFVLWRIAASEHYSCRQVKLDAHLPRLRDIIRNPSIGGDREYPIIIQQLCGPVLLDDAGAPASIYSREIPLNPTAPHDAFGVEAVDFELSGYIISVGLGPRPDATPWQQASLGLYDVPLVWWHRFEDHPKWQFLKAEISKAR